MHRLAQRVAKLEEIPRATCVDIGEGMEMLLAEVCAAHAMPAETRARFLCAWRQYWQTVLRGIPPRVPLSRAAALANAGLYTVFPLVSAWWNEAIYALRDEILAVMEAWEREEDALQSET